MTILITNEQERIKNILNDEPGIFEVEDNPDANRYYRDLYDFEHDGLLAVTRYKDILEKEAKDQNINPDIVKAIMFVENAHGAYGHVFESIGIAKSIFPMNIQYGLWGSLLNYAKEDFKNPRLNIRAGVTLIKRIIERLEPKDRIVAKIATLYNDTGEDKVSNYGAKVQRVYDEQLWDSKPSEFMEKERVKANYQNVEDLLNNDPEIQELKKKRDAKFIEIYEKEYGKQFSQYIRRGISPNAEKIKDEANKYFPELRRLEDIMKYKKLGKAGRRFEWIGSGNPNACGLCSSLEGQVFSYDNPPDCGFPPIHPHCNCSIEEVAGDEFENISKYTTSLRGA
jgi:hypothetical protein